MFVKLAVMILTNALRKDRELWWAYQSNIAICFQDEVNRDGPKIPKDKLYAISNRAANNFLRIWTRKCQKIK